MIVQDLACAWYLLILLKYPRNSSQLTSPSLFVSIAWQNMYPHPVSSGLYHLKHNPNFLVHNQCWHIMTILIVFLPHQVKHLDHQHEAEHTRVHPYWLSRVLHLLPGYVAVRIGVVEPEGPPEPVLFSAPQQQGEGQHKFLWRIWGKVWNVRILTWNVMTPAPAPSSRENR